MLAKLVISLALACVFLGTSNASTMPIESQDNCAQVCPLLYAPLCGTDGVNFMEFSNPCEMDAANCRLQRASVKREF